MSQVGTYRLAHFAPRAWNYVFPEVDARATLFMISKDNLSGRKVGADGCDVVVYLIAAQKVVELFDKGLL
jgi:hypothetical protein